MPTSLEDFIKSIGEEIRNHSKNYGKDSINDFKEFVKEEYKIIIGAKWDEEKKEIFIRYYLPELSRIYSGETQTPFLFPLDN